MLGKIAQRLQEDECRTKAARGVWGAVSRLEKGELRQIGSIGADTAGTGLDRHTRLRPPKGGGRPRVNHGRDRQEANVKLSDFKVLTFDCYGTLIDWESGMIAALAPLTDRLAHPPSRNEVLEAHGRLEASQQMSTPRSPIVSFSRSSTGAR